MEVDVLLLLLQTYLKHGGLAAVGCIIAGALQHWNASSALYTYYIY